MVCFVEKGGAELVLLISSSDPNGHWPWLPRQEDVYEVAFSWPPMELVTLR